jgi:predicted RNA binding protein YcfA (HicA-like mRNA interferase family)
VWYVLKYGQKGGCGVTFREADKLVKDDGRQLDSIVGPHHHYKHKKSPAKSRYLIIAEISLKE